MHTRRRFLSAAGGLGAVAVLAPTSLAEAVAGARRARPFAGGSFPDGVISGDPTSTGITLWTRLEDVGGRGTLALEVARDRGFRKVVATKAIAATEARNFTAKVRVTGLDPHERYFYRFATKRSHSSVGRFQTAAPPDSNEPVRFALFSCQEYTYGWYNAHALMAKDDLDFVLNLGDYIYADVAFDPPIGVRSGNFTTSEGFTAITQDEYRQRYHTYRSDPHLRAVHAKFPMISGWDDHEVQNNYSGGDPTGGTATGDPYSPQRRDTAFGVWFEQMPTFPIGRARLYHKATFGRTMDLFVLDERKYRASNPCGDKAGPPCPDLNNPRAFLGDAQLAFVNSGLKRSKARWKVIANELVMSLLRSEADPGSLRNYDAWEGFPVEREALLRTVGGVEGVVFATGDEHAFIASDVQKADGTTVAPEFGGASITAASTEEVRSIVGQSGWGTPDHTTLPPGYLEGLYANNPWVYDYDPIRHGYVRIEATRKELRATARKLATIREQTTALSEQTTYTVARGQRGVKA